MVGAVLCRASNEGQTKVRENLNITEKAPREGHLLVGAFNQEKVPVRAFSEIVKTDGSFAALM